MESYDSIELFFETTCILTLCQLLQNSVNLNRLSWLWQEKKYKRLDKCCVIQLKFNYACSALVGFVFRVCFFDLFDFIRCSDTKSIYFYHWMRYFYPHTRCEKPSGKFLQRSFSGGNGPWLLYKTRTSMLIRRWYSDEMIFQLTR